MAKEISAAKMRFSVVSKQDKALFSSLLQRWILEEYSPLPGLVGNGRERQIDPSTVSSTCSPIVFPADALGNRARGLERELKASGRYIKMRRSNSKSFCL
jgi:hypothetical protein